jgi:type 2 lantibiotic biosynthesis protein LanM
MGIGGIGGLGSIIYLLVKIARLLDNSALLDQALKAAKLLHPEDIDSDESYDIISGSAGTLIALLALYKCTGDRNSLDLAEHCGRHLAKRRVLIGDGMAGWQSESATQPLTGFSHGSAGISYALLRLYETTRDEAYYNVAREAIAYEQSTFSAAKSNWPDFRKFDGVKWTPLFSCSWCHGAPGIALARLGSLHIIDDLGIRNDLEIALQTTSEALACCQLPVDHLCCGNFGLIDVLLVAGITLGRPSLHEEAVKQARALCQQEKSKGSFRLLGRMTTEQTFFSPTFFQGLAGIGYQLLRLSSPDALPSVLFLE